MLTRETTLSVITTGFVLFCGLADVRAQTAACCVGDACQALDEQACSNQDGQWLGTHNPPISDCAAAPCTTGACCLRYVTCAENMATTTCADDGGVYWPLSSCSLAECLPPPNDECADAEPICQNVCTHPTDNLLSSRRSCQTTADCVAPDECLPWAPDPDNGYCANGDVLDDGPICSRSAWDCYDGSPCRPATNGVDIYRCFADKDNRFATTDGPSAGGDCLGSGENGFQADVWHKITAPCTGILVIDECMSQLAYDGMLAVFGDGTPEYADGACQITTNDDLIICDDDFCPGRGVSGVQADVVEGATYLLRSGGWSEAGTAADADRGQATMNIGFICPPQPPPCGPEGWHLPPGTIHHAPKNRYITINLSGYVSQLFAYQVRLSEMNRCTNDTRRACNVDEDCPGICTDNIDIQCSTDALCATNGVGTCVPSGPCGPHADVGTVVGYIGEPFTRSCIPNDDCIGEFFANVVDAPVYRVWTEDTVHITGCEIIPAAVYEILSFDAITGAGICPVTIATVAKPADLHYGDVVGPVTGGLFAPPDGFTGVIDIHALLIAQQGGAQGVSPPHTTWVDLHGTLFDETCPGTTCVIPQQILSVSDLGRIKFAFIGMPYVDTPGQVDPGDCP